MDEVVIGLHGNGTPCPACELRRETANMEISGAACVLCNNCGGTSWVQKSDQQIVDEACQWARDNYWPAREAVFARHNARAK